MGEYWNQFLNWLTGGDKQIPIAPRAEDRYANSSRIYSDTPFFNYNINYNPHSNRAGVILNTPYSIMPAVITREILGNDTIYREHPSQPRYQKTILRPIIKTRKASNRDKNRSEYDILKRRFNTAWNIAKEPK